MFNARGGTFIAQAAAGGPWSPSHCHGGAVSAIVAHAAEQVHARAPMQIARLTLDLMGPVPIDQRLEVDTNIVKDGRKSQIVELAIRCDDVVVATASILKVRVTDAMMRGDEAFAPDPSLPRALVPCGFAEQFEIAVERGGFGQIGPGRLWFKWNGAFLDGAPAGPAERASGIADFANGFAMDLSFSDWSWPTLDLNVGLARYPVDEWIIVDATTHLSDGGRAFCVGTLEDSQGVFGHCSQSVFVEKRSAPIDMPFGKMRIPGQG